MALTPQDIADSFKAGLITEAQLELAVEAVEAGKSLAFKGDPRQGDLRVVEGQGQRFQPIPEPGGVLGSLGQGFEQGASDILAGGAQLGGRAAELAGVEGGRQVQDVATRFIENQAMKTEGVTAENPIAGGIGQIAGQVAALPLGGATIPRAIAAGGFAGAVQPTAGGTEGDIERGINTLIGGATGGIFQAAMPVAANLVKRGMNRAGAVASSVWEALTKAAPPPGSFDSAGNPTPEFVAAIQKRGVSPDDLDAAVRNFSEDGTFTPLRTDLDEPSQAIAERAARFEGQQIPALRGNLSQDFADQARESRLLSSASDTAIPLRQRVLQQSEAFKAEIGRLVDATGIPDNAGKAVKDALSGRRTLLRKQKNNFYKKAAEADPNVLKMPLFTDEILTAVPDAATIRRIQTLAPQQTEALKNLLVEFGIDRSDEAVEKFAESGGEVIPLTLGTFDTFRQALNQISNSDQSGSILKLTGPIKNALDMEATAVDAAAKAAGITDPVVLDMLTQARQRVTQIKTEFNPKSIVGQLVENKKNSDIPVIEASKVSGNLTATGTPIENVERVVDSLIKAGPDGQKALGDLQATIPLQALEKALAAPSRKIDGVEVLGGNQFAKAIAAIGDDKLKVIFRGNPKGLARLKGLAQTAKDIEPTAGAIPKGSAAVLMDIARSVVRLPGVAQVAGPIAMIFNAGADERTVARALKARPKLVPQATVFNEAFPAIANALGVRAALVGQDALDTQVE